jgi:TolA-binding protein
MTVFERYLASYSKSPYHDDVRFQLGQAYFQQEQYPQALKLFQAIVTTPTDDRYLASASFMSGACLYAQNQFQAAIVQYDRAVSAAQAVLADTQNETARKEAEHMLYDAIFRIGLSYIRLISKLFSGIRRVRSCRKPGMALPGPITV